MTKTKNSTYEEIVAVIIDENIITNSWATIILAIRFGRYIRPLSRIQMQFMANADLGQKWNSLANGPTLFLQDGEGNLIFPNTETIEVK